MNFIKFDILIKQILPPHWRSGGRYTLMLVALAPLQYIYTQIQAYRKQAMLQMNHNAQTMSIVHYATTIVQKRGSYIQTSENGESFTLHLPTGYTDQQYSQIQAHLSKVVPAGINYQIKTI